MNTSDNPTCSGCGGPHPFDTTVPSVIWNTVIRANDLPEYLCITCIIYEFAKRRVNFTAELWGKEFSGVKLSITVSDPERRIGF